MPRESVSSIIAAGADRLTMPNSISATATKSEKVTAAVFTMSFPKNETSDGAHTFRNPGCVRRILYPKK